MKFCRTALQYEISQFGISQTDGRTGKHTSILGAFVKLRRATISFVMSIRLSVRPHGTTRYQLDGFS